MCNFLVNRSDSRVVVNGSESSESRVRFVLVFLLKKFPLILSKLNARSGIRTHYLEKSTLIFIREITLKFLKGIPFKIEKWRKIVKNWIVRNFLKNLKIVIFFDFFAEDVLKSLLRGPKTIRKKYQVVFEKFANLCSESQKKNQPPILAKLFEKKNIPIFFREYSKINFRNIYFSELKKLRKIMK